MNEEVNFCSQCGAKVSLGAKFCSNCGYDLQNSSTKTSLDANIKVKAANIKLETTNATLEKGFKAVGKGFGAGQVLENMLSAAQVKSLTVLNQPQAKLSSKEQLELYVTCSKICNTLI